MRVALGLFLAALFLAGPWLGAGLLFASVPTLKDLANVSPSVAIFVALGAAPLVASAGLVSTTALAVALGMVLPFPVAWIIGTVACIVATALHLVAARSTLAPTLARLADRSGKARRIAESLRGMSPWRTASIFGVARLAPHVPFAATNLALGSLQPPAIAAVLGSGAGGIVRMGVFAWVGRGVTDVKEVLSTSDGGPIWTIVSIGAGIVLLFFVARILVKRVGLG